MRWNGRISVMFESGVKTKARSSFLSRARVSFTVARDSMGLALAGRVSPSLARAVVVIRSPSFLLDLIEASGMRSSHVVGVGLSAVGVLLSSESDRLSRVLEKDRRRGEVVGEDAPDPPEEGPRGRCEEPRIPEDPPPPIPRNPG